MSAATVLHCFPYYDRGKCSLIFYMCRLWGTLPLWFSKVSFCRLYSVSHFTMRTFLSGRPAFIARLDKRIYEKGAQALTSTKGKQAQRNWYLVECNGRRSNLTHMFVGVERRVPGGNPMQTHSTWEVHTEMTGADMGLQTQDLLTMKQQC